MTVIMCATDLSPESARVVAIAGSFAQRLNASVEIFHALHPPPNVPPDLMSEEVIHELRTRADALIAKEADILRERRIDVRTVVGIDVVDNLGDRARALGACLLVIGTHGRKGAARLLLGSWAERTLRNAPCPVLVVPTGPMGRLARDGAPSLPLSVEVSVDFSAASDAALDWLRDFRERAPCEVRLVHLFSPAREHERLGLEPPVAFQTDPEVIEVLSRDLRARIHEHIDTDFPLRIRPSWTDEDDPLAWEAESDDADLLVIGIDQGRRSTALATVRGAHLPVVCVPVRDDTHVRTRGPIRTVFVPTDFSVAGNTAITEAYRLLAADGGTVVLAHVAASGEYGLGLDPERQEEIETCLLGLVPDDIDTARIHTRAFAIAAVSPGAAIVKAIRRFGADMVVIASHGADRRGRADVTQHLVWHSPCPVLVVPS